MIETYLYHHGVKGMHWGVRRYRNKDGSLTEEGKSRYYNTDGSPTKKGRIALMQNKININDRREQQRKLHNSKPKRENEFSNREYLLTSARASKGQDYIRHLEKQIKDGYVTSFVEDSKGNINVKGKTSKGVVIRDKDGNRVTAYDYSEAQNIIWKQRKCRINTGMW